MSTDYVFLGFSQANENSAISGGFDYSFDGGVDVGIWVLNVDFGGDAPTEIDFYAGCEFDFTDTVSLDFLAIYFIYAGELEALTYSEFIATAGIGDGNLGVICSSDCFGTDTSAVVFNADYSLGLTEVLSLYFHMGYTKVDDVDEVGFDGKGDYVDYFIGLSAPVAGVDLSLVAYGADVDVADERIVFSSAKTF